jgi:hypothetical protein
LRHRFAASSDHTKPKRAFQRLPRIRAVPPLLFRLLDTLRSASLASRGSYHHLTTDQHAGVRPIIEEIETFSRSIISSEWNDQKIVKMKKKGKTGRGTLPIRMN